MSSDAPAGREACARAPFVLVPQFFGCTVFERRTSRYLPFDQETTALLTRLAAEPFDAVLAELDDDEARDRHVRFFEHFYTQGLFSLDSLFVGEVLDVRPPADHLAGPLAVHLEVADTCNLACAHCFAAGPRTEQHPLTLAELGRLFAALASLGSFRLGLTGGEPLLRRDLLDILDLAAGHGLHTCLTTNGLLLTEDLAAEFGKRELLWLNVSLDGATAQSNDRIRGSGTFARVLERAKMLARRARVTLAFTVTRDNLDEIGQCVKLAREVGAETAVFRPLYPVGRARHHPELMPTFADYSRAIDALAHADNEAPTDLCSLDPFGPRSRTASQAVTQVDWGCGAGSRVCSISLGGDVSPCSFLGPVHVAGNLRRESFRSIWDSSAVLRDMRGQRQATPGPAHGTFAGGCRARALAFNGSVHAPDPWVLDAAACGTASSRGPLAVLQIQQ